MEQFTMAFPINYAKIRNKVKCVYLIINNGGGIIYSIIINVSSTFFFSLGLKPSSFIPLEVLQIT